MSRLDDLEAIKATADELIALGPVIQAKLDELKQLQAQAFALGEACGAVNPTYASGSRSYRTLNTAIRRAGLLWGETHGGGTVEDALRFDWVRVFRNNVLDEIRSRTVGWTVPWSGPDRRGFF